ncbi:peptidoglycan glycosyltransferase [Balneicella halophila]|uniref:Peptidoglycan glycosyltransferase n=1 Tax=Balneicella halophila TaxID=1537566 RepID=A0A7L4UQ46_BALHA|nr:penicillin-binding protein 2 [Balneicella halophila]PVX50712.1 peptidoglycan glycosyltransferase [Balneicella halophila]
MSSYYNRQFIIRAVIIVVGVIFISQLAYLQLFEDEYSNKGLSISHIEEIKTAPRGLVYDRKGTLLVNNTNSFALSVIPRIAKEKGLDTTLLATLLEIPREDLIERLDKASKESRYYFKYAKVFNNLTPVLHARMKEYLYKFPGFTLEKSEGRSYNYLSLAHTMGYVKEVNDKELAKDEYYRLGDYIGKAGIEKTYEKELRGEKGAAFFLQDNKQRIVGPLEEGARDIETIPGNNLTLCIDIDLQEYAMKLMNNKRGAVIAIKPSSGEVLVKLSSPTFNLDSLYGINGGKYYQSLNMDNENKPLFDRTILAQYPPGSIFKLINAGIGMQEGIITSSYRKSCHGGASIGNFFMNCHEHSSPVGVLSSIQNSCNPFYCHFFVDLLHNSKFRSVQDGYKHWRDYVISFGLGQKLGSDFPTQRTGNIPTIEYYNKKLKRKNWVALNIVSVSIGQGELMITPLQMANMVTTIANKGYFYTPHVVKSIGDKGKRDEYTEKHTTAIDADYFDIIHQGMENVVNSGTGTLARVPNIRVAGKTGTVQHTGKGEAHSVFVAFAPVENPQIALLVYVENGVWGGRYAAPIAGLLIEKYLTDSISPSKKWIEKRMMETSLITPKEKEVKNDSIQ